MSIYSITQLTSNLVDGSIIEHYPFPERLFDTVEEALYQTVCLYAINNCISFSNDEIHDVMIINHENGNKKLIKNVISLIKYIFDKNHIFYRTKISFVKDFIYDKNVYGFGSKYPKNHLTTYNGYYKLFSEDDIIVARLIGHKIIINPIRALVENINEI